MSSSWKRFLDDEPSRSINDLTPLNAGPPPTLANRPSPPTSLSYSHPAAAVKFFCWSGTRIQHQHSPYSWNFVVDLLGKNFLLDTMWDAVSFINSEGLVSLATFASIFFSFAAAGRPDDAAAAFKSLPHHGIPHDTTALNSLFPALSREGLTFNALTSMRHIRLRIPPDSDSYAILLEGFENERNYPRTREVFDENGIAREEIGNSLVGRFQYHKLLPEACKYSEGMIDKVIKLHSSTLSKLRSSLHQMGKSPMHDEILSKWKKASSDRSL